VPRDLDLSEQVQRAWRRTAEREIGEREEEGASDDPLRLEEKIAPGARTIRADPVLVGQIFGNLFANARRYARQGPVTVESRIDGDRVRIRVVDGGPGVAEEHRERLFEPFFRADRARSMDSGNVGLGLMVVRRAVAAHGGRVGAEPTPGGGLTLVFDLPGGDPSSGDQGSRVSGSPSSDGASPIR
jgi:two-component system sensor histidine kinase KdpD